MEHDEEQVRLPYEHALRAIGRHLDAEPAYHVSVLEITDGFVVRSHPARHRTQGRTVEFDWAKLRYLTIFHTAGRHITSRRQRHRGIWENFPNGHEDFFRALGFILDQEKARSIAIEEVPEGVAVSYSRPHHAAEDSFEKFHAVHQRSQIETMVEQAVRRRGDNQATA
ncbi:MAG: hypothetical protein NVSMB52_17590 [Chloroflexota bacterium]